MTKPRTTEYWLDVYLAQGRLLFPLHSIDDHGRCTCYRQGQCRYPGKHPLWVPGELEQGVYDASQNPSVVWGWQKRWPWANWAVVARELVIVDQDFEVADFRAPIEALHLSAEDLRTPQVRTPRGRHIYFSSAGEQYSSSNALLPDGYDVRTGFSYAVLPPSRHASLQDYEWFVGLSVQDVSVQPVPESFALFLKPQIERDEAIIPTPPPEALFTAEGLSPYAAAALEREQSRLLNSRVGERNQNLNAVSFSLFQLQDAGLLPGVDLAGLLTGIALNLGLEGREIAATIKSAQLGAAKKPRTVWPATMNKMKDAPTYSPPAKLEESENPPEKAAVEASSVTSLWAQLRDAGISLRLEGDTIWAWPKELITQQVANCIRTNKPKLVRMLQAQEKRSGE
ncbi:MAG: bifunctional DNA primase/polymerase [Anaerolineae bacterium]|nr:bifunctional DNA primase/polymerase [Anaerolineae bacterium]